MKNESSFRSFCYPNEIFRHQEQSSLSDQSNGVFQGPVRASLSLSISIRPHSTGMIVNLRSDEHPLQSLPTSITRTLHSSFLAFNGVRIQTRELWPYVDLIRDTATSFCPSPTSRSSNLIMIEDDIYRTSSQYRLWSYTTSSLQSLRATTNSVASERVRAAIRRARENNASTTSSAAGTPQPGGDGEPKRLDEKQIECLTPEEELVLVRYYCEKTLELGDTYKPPLPTMVRVSLTLGRSYRKGMLS